ncbi:Fur family transcriptional regulator, partial [Leucobacter sp. HY1910]
MKPRRNTWQREAVRAALASAHGFVSAQQLHQTLRDAGSTIGLATVYRALASLTEDGEADSIQAPE